jgi:hypothetical protein
VVKVGRVSDKDRLRERCRHAIRQLHERIAALEKENAALRAKIALLREKPGR